jgi:hypothetical protein
MIRFSLLMLLSTNLFAAEAPATGSAVDIGSAAELYQAAEIRAQVRASLVTMPDKIRQMFAADSAAHLSDQQLDAVTNAAKKGFQIVVFEPPALSAFASNLDAVTVKKSIEFLSSDVGRRMVAADVVMSRLDEPTINKVMQGEMTAPATPVRTSLTNQLERDIQSTDAAVDVYLRVGRSIAVGTAIGSGMDPIAADQRARKAEGQGAREDLVKTLLEPLRRYVAYGYRDMSDADLKRVASFLESGAGKHFVGAYNAAMSAGYEAMSERCGERIGETWRELAMAQMAPPDLRPATPKKP